MRKACRLLLAICLLVTVNPVANAAVINSGETCPYGNPLTTTLLLIPSLFRMWNRKTVSVI